MNLLSLTWWRMLFAKGGRVFAVGCAIAFIAPIVISVGFSYNQRRNNQDTSPNGTLAVVNGQPVSTTELAWIPSEYLGGSPGSAHAGQFGSVVKSVIDHKIIEQFAAKENIHPTDADVDSAVSKARESRGGAKLSDQEWESYLEDQMHSTPEEFRTHIQSEAVIQAILDHYKNAEKVTVDDAKNQYSEVKLSTVFVASVSPSSRFQGAPKSLPDAEAEKKAIALHDKAVAGADIIPMAKANPDMFQATAKATGISDWQKENQESQIGSSLMYGKAVDEAVRATAVNKITPVVKASGFLSGYFFAKVVARRVELPKDYDVNKVTSDLKTKQASLKLQDIIKAKIEAAKVEFPKDQSDMKAYYDYAMWQSMQQEMNGGMTGTPAAGAPTQAEVDAQKTRVDADFEAMLKAHPDDTTAELMVADSLTSKMALAPAPEQAKMRDRLISLYESSFKTTESIPNRFALASLYKDKLDYKSAFKEYMLVKKLIDGDPPYDLNTRQKQLASRTQLNTALRSLPTTQVPEATAEITEQTTKIADLNTKIAEDRKKADAERLAQDKIEKDAQKKAAEDAKKAIKPGTPTTAGTTSPSTGTTPPASGATPPTTGATTPANPPSGGSGSLKPAPGPAPGSPTGPGK